jgi:hypothetical protein
MMIDLPTNMRHRWGRNPGFTSGELQLQPATREEVIPQTSRLRSFSFSLQRARKFRRYPRLDVWGCHGWNPWIVQIQPALLSRLPLHDECSQPIFGSEVPHLIAPRETPQ